MATFKELVALQEAINAGKAAGATEQAAFKAASNAYNQGNLEAYVSTLPNTNPTTSPTVQRLPGNSYVNNGKVVVIGSPEDLAIRHGYRGPTTPGSQRLSQNNPYNSPTPGSGFNELNRANEYREKQQRQNEEEYQSILAQINNLEANAGYITTPEQAAEHEAQRKAAIERANELAQILNKPAQGYDARDRADKNFSGDLKVMGADYSNALFTGVDAYNQSRAYTMGMDEIRAAEAAGIDWQEQFAADKAAYNSEEAQNKRNERYAKSDAMRAEGEAQRAAAREGATGFEQVLFDLGSGATQLAADAVLATINPALATTSMAARTFGGSAAEARQSGADLAEQVLYGSANALVAVGLGKALDGVAGIYGKGWGDDLSKALINKISNTPKGRAIAQFVSRVGGEFGEELTEGAVNPVLKAIYDEGEALRQIYSSPEAWAEALTENVYSGLIGAALSAGTQPVAAIKGDYSNLLPGRELDTSDTPAVSQPATSVEPTTTNVQPQLATQIVNTLLSSGRINNTDAAAIASNPIALQAFSNITGTAINPAGKTANEVRTEIQKAAQDFAYRHKQATNVVADSKVALTEQSVVDSARDAAVAGAVTPRSQASYIRGALQNGTTAVEAKTIYDNPVLRQLWEAASGRTLPESRNKAIDAIMTSRQITDASILPVLRALEARLNAEASANATETPQNAQAVSGDIHTPPTPTNASTGDSGVLNNGSQQSGVDMLVEIATGNKNTAPDGAESTAVNTDPTQQPPANVNPSTVTGNGQTTAESTMGVGPERERGGSANIRSNLNVEPALRASFEAKPEMYTQLTNAQVLDRANAILGKGFTEAYNEVRAAVTNAKGGMKLSPEYAVAAQEIANELVGLGRLSEARSLQADVIAEFTAAGQFSQIGRLIRQTDPTAKAMAIERMVDKLNANLTRSQKAKNIKAGRGDKYGNITLSKDLLNRFAAAPDDAVRDAVLDEITSSIASQIPPTFRERFTAFRYLNMLGNFKTQGRNISGNALASVAAVVKRRIQAGIELGVALNSESGYERNTSFIVPPALYKQSSADFDNVAIEAMGEDKYSDVGAIANKAIQDKRKILPGPLEAYRRATNKTMEIGDRIFLRFNYADALSGWLNAHGIKDIAEASPEQLAAARSFAIKEAQQATFRDDNKVTEAINKFGRGKDTPQVVRAISEGILPFRKTPANVAVRAVEYSPLGFLKAGYDAAKMKNGATTPADVINDVAKSATGTALAVAGYLLAAAGLARGTEEDDKLADFQENQGKMDYSIKLGDEYVSLSQFAPMAVPFFMGVKLQEIIESQEGAFSLDTMGKLLGAISDPMLEMSMLGGVNDAFSNLSSFSGDADALPQFVANSIMNYLTQGLTNSLVGQFEQASEKNRQTIYTEKATELDKMLGNAQYKVGQTLAKIPTIDYHQQDYVDAWGRTQSAGTSIERYINAFLNPTYTSADRSTAVDAELERLYSDNKGVEDFPEVFPKKRGRSATYGDNKVMTADEYLQFSKESGQRKLELVSEFMDSAEYDNLSDMQRAEVISKLYAFADDRALKKVKENNNENSATDWDDEAALPDLAYYLGAKTAYTDAADKDNATPNYAAVDAVLADIENMDRATRDMLDEQSGFKNLRFASEVYGMSAEQAMGIKKQVEVEQEKALGDMDSGVADAVAISKVFDEYTDEQKIAALEVLNLPYADTGTRSSIARRFEAAQLEGIGFNDWAKLEALIDSTKTSNNPSKAVIKAAAKELGFDGNTIYRVYASDSKDEDLVAQENDYFHKDYVKPEEVDMLDYLAGLTLPTKE